MKTSAFVLYIRRASPEVQHANLFILTDAICAKAPSGGFMVYQVQTLRLSTWVVFNVSRFHWTWLLQASFWFNHQARRLKCWKCWKCCCPQFLSQEGGSSPSKPWASWTWRWDWRWKVGPDVSIIDTYTFWTHRHSQTQSDRRIQWQFAKSFTQLQPDISARQGAPWRDQVESFCAWCERQAPKKDRVSFVRSLSEALQGKAKLQKSRSSNPRNVPGSAGFVTRGCLRRHAGCSTGWSGSGVGPGVSDSVSSEFILSTFNLFLSNMELFWTKSTESIGFNVIFCRQTWWDPGWIRQDIL